jgi:2-succinyl-5-enolpyruvyl-6-hydroxy-3-cyclohexene-1-carboxylate synthase
MPINFSNTNSIWASVLVETLYHLGLTTAVICPGSRSAPLAVAFAQHDQIHPIPVLDERSAAFFALGLARQSGLPTILVCTSGTAGANVYPAVIEARESRVSLLVLTADRPPELRNCNSGQTIDQQKLYGNFPLWYSELATPSLEPSMLAYLRQTIIHAWERSLHPIPGPIHLNLPFRDPLAPLPQPEAQALEQTFPADFFAFIKGGEKGEGEGGTGNREEGIAWDHPFALCPSPFALPIAEWQQSTRGIIIAGVAQPRSPRQYCEAIAHFSKTLGFPVLAEGLSPVRNYVDLNPYLVSTYDLILRNPDLAEQLAPDIVIRIGEMPTSKELRAWLQVTQPRQWIVDGGDRNLDPLHGKTTHLHLSVEQLTRILANQFSESEDANDPKHLSPRQPSLRTSLPTPNALPPSSSILDPASHPTSYLNFWCTVETKFRQFLNQMLSQTEHLFEGKVAWLLSQYLPERTPLFIANSMPVRDVEWFWQPGNRAMQPFFNRGANGIDGTLSTALGIAYRNQSSVLLTGDLALLHDTNGFLLQEQFVGHLTIVLINNNGGGIFEMLPIANFDPPFTDFFATPQIIDFAQLCASYGVEYERIITWQTLQQRLTSLPTEGIRVLEIPTDRRADAQWRQHCFNLATRLMI